MICDDLLDYGNTFINLSKLLKKDGAKEVNLFITHGLFTGGKDIIFKHINRIFDKSGEHGKENNK